MVFILVTLLVTIIIASMLTYVGMSPLVLFDFPAIIVVILTSGICLLSSHSLKDFFFSFRIIFSKGVFKKEQLEKSIDSINLVIKNLFYACAVIGLISTLIYFNHVDGDNSWTVCLATTICTTLYTSILSLYLNVMKNIIQRKKGNI